MISYLPSFRKKSFNGFSEMKIAITSGSLMNLKVFYKIGPFIEDLFIDYVDFEYCLRLKKNKYQILQVKSAQIYHQLGELKLHKFFFKKIYVTNHSPTRYYYRTRNRLYVVRKYLNVFPSFVIRDFLIFFNELIKIIFYEKNKIKKMKMILFGIRDFMKNNYGKYDISIS